jgi:uncharacterized tellurite resistance protein B-like protein|tara:strand:+ start:2520 stop:2879 length:360 start_codon:yes stop_codon:yes gene_type:complete
MARINQFLHATYSLAAAMVCADGKIDPDEIVVAERIGKDLFGEFDSAEFRGYCVNPGQVADIELLAKALGAVLADEDKVLIMNYLHAISEADGDVCREEELLLQKVSRSWNVALTRGGI